LFLNGGPPVLCVKQDLNKIGRTPRWERAWLLRAQTVKADATFQEFLKKSPLFRGLVI
jgi:hypothetical protein